MKSAISEGEVFISPFFIKNKNMNILPKGIYNLEYSEKQRLFMFESDINKDCSGWVKLKIMSLEDSTSFCEFMDNKYVKGRLSGILPELDVVKLELELFFALKNNRRKLAGRNK